MHIFRSYALAASIISLAGCGAGVRNGPLPLDPAAAAARGPAENAASAFEMDSLRPDAPNPGTIKVPPMPVGSKVFASVMLAHTPHSVAPQSIGSLKFSQIPGSATQVVASPDGSLWALSTQPAGSNKAIFHYANGKWTNVPGSAASIAIDASGQELYAVNATTGGLYGLYIPTNTWTALGGGVRSVTGALIFDPNTYNKTEAVYALSSKIVNGNSAIFEYYQGAWYQAPGAGALLAADWDFGTWNVRGVGSVTGDGVYVGNATHSIFYFTPVAGSPGSGSYQKFPGSAGLLAPTSAGLFAFGSVQSGNAPLYFFDFNPGSWSSEAGAGISASASTTNLFVVNSANAIYSGSLGNNSAVAAFPNGTDARAITVGSDKNLWFTVGSGAAAGAGKYNPTNNTYAFYNTPVAPGDGSIALASDGNVYFSVFNTKGVTGADVYEVTPSGGITGFVAPTSTSENSGIAAGPDKNVWVTESIAGKIAKFTIPGHAFTEYPVTSGSGPAGIVTGPDGALWYTEYYSNAIGRITAAGVHTNDFPLPTAKALPLSICVGSDGNLWFTEDGVGKIGRITPTGTVTEFPVPSGAGTQPFRITSGPDENLWYSDGQGAFVGRMTTAGVATEYPSPDGRYFSILKGIATGPDGNLYFPDSGSSTMDRISPSNP
jgi:streptogramin lyase/predicted small lipoprotein YifL